MTIQEFYNSVGGDYSEVKSRLVNDVIVKKFLLKFPSDGSFVALKEAISANEAEKAFMAAHTLKGVTVSLGLGDLHNAAKDITELLRGASVADTDEVKATFVRVEENYNRAISLIETIN